MSPIDTGRKGPKPLAEITRRIHRSSLTTPMKLIYNNSPACKIGEAIARRIPRVPPPVASHVTGILFMCSAGLMLAFPVHYVNHIVWEVFAFSFHGIGLIPLCKLAERKLFP